MNADKVSAYKVAKEVLPLGTSYEVVWRLALWFLDAELDSDTDRQVSVDFAQGEAFLIRRRGNSLPLDEAEAGERS